MIEIPEAVTLSAQLAESLSGRQIQTVEAGHTPHKFAWYYGTPDNYGKISAGREVEGARAVGGMVEVAAGDLRLLFSEGAGLRLRDPGSEPPGKHQLLITFSDGAMLSVSVQMYGGMGIFREGECENEYYLTAIEKPSPLSGRFDWSHFAQILEAPSSEKLSAKAVLATGQRIPGLGNGVLQDILFNARVSPRTKLAALGEASRGRLFGAVKATLEDMVTGGGRDTELDLFGNPGGYRTLMSRATVGKPCPVCSEVIQKASYMGGSVYFCPSCQPEIPVD